MPGSLNVGGDELMSPTADVLCNVEGMHPFDTVDCVDLYWLLLEQELEL